MANNLEQNANTGDGRHSQPFAHQEFHPCARQTEQRFERAALPLSCGHVDGWLNGRRERPHRQDEWNEERQRHAGLFTLGGHITLADVAVPSQRIQRLVGVESGCVNSPDGLGLLPSTQHIEGPTPCLKTLLGR